MIRVNLLRSLGLTTASPVGSGGSFVISEDVQKQAFLKLLFIIIIPFCLKFWSDTRVKNLKRQLNELQTEIKNIESQKKSFGDAAPIFEKYKKEESKIKEQSDTIRQLAENRLRELKALDSLQSLTPSQVWYKFIEVEGSNVRASGYSSSEEGIAQLFSALNGSPVFSRFEPGAQAEQLINGSRVKSFEVSFQIGRSDESSESYQ